MIKAGLDGCQARPVIATYPPLCPRASSRDTTFGSTITDDAVIGIKCPIISHVENRKPPGLELRAADFKSAGLNGSGFAPAQSESDVPDLRA